MDDETREDIEEVEEQGEDLDADGMSMGCSCDAAGAPRSALGSGLLLLGLLGLRRR